MKNPVGCCVVACLCLALVSTGATGRDESLRLDDLEKKIAEVMADWDVPGLAITVVSDGRILHLKGYGVKEVGGTEPVTSHTLFATGSCSKSVTATAIALLVDAGMADWETPLITYLPWLEFSDPYVTSSVTFADLLSHRTGLGRNDAIWYGSPKTRKQIVEATKYLEFAQPFRSGFAYNNLMYILAGYVAGSLNNSSFEQLVEKRVFQPLEMYSSTYSPAGAEDIAQPHREMDGITRKISFRATDAAAPAAGLYTNAEDLTNWLFFLTSGGEFNNRVLLSSASMEKLLTPRTVLPWYPEDEFLMTSYGMGFWLTAYRDHYIVYHPGGIDGFSAEVSIIPATGTGVAVLTNKSSTRAARIIALYVLDQLTGREPIDWNRRYLDERAERMQQVQVVGDQEIGKVEPPTLPLSSYIGMYQHPAFGDLSIRQDGENLEAFCFGEWFVLKHVNQDLFSFSQISFGTLEVSFILNEHGAVESLTCPVARGFEAKKFVKQ